MFIYVSENTDDFQKDYENNIDNRIRCIKQLNKHWEYCNISNTNVQYFYNLENLSYRHIQ